MVENYNICPICSTATSVEDLSDNESYRVNCPRCGLLQITESALTMFQRSKVAEKELSISFTIRNNQLKEKPYFINETKLRKILVDFSPPSPQEQANKLLLWIANTVNKYDGTTNEELLNLIPVIGSTDKDGVKYVSDYLKSQGYISHNGFAYSIVDGRRNPPKDMLNAQMTFKGWARVDELEKSNVDSRLAFMAMAFNNKDLREIFNEYIKSAVKETGFKIRTVNEEKRAGSIDDKLRVEIRRSKFLISDLTDDNNGAYWEAGYAEGLGIPVIYICEKEKFEKEKSHFDTNHHLTVPWDKDKLPDFLEELKATIRATFPNEAKMED